MGRILVLFDSRSGHTEAMAAEVAIGARSIDGTKVRVRAVTDAEFTDLKWCDGVAVGSPAHMGALSWPMKRWWDEVAVNGWGRLDGRIGCAFSSAGGWGGGAETTCLSLLHILINFGFLVFGVTDYVAPGFTLHYGGVAQGAPDEERERQACRRLGQRLAEWVAVCREHRTDVLPKDLPEALGCHKSAAAEAETQVAKDGA